MPMKAQVRCAAAHPQVREHSDNLVALGLPQLKGTRYFARQGLDSERHAAPCKQRNCHLALLVQDHALPYCHGTLAAIGHAVEP